MHAKELIVKEFEKRIFEESYERIYTCLSMIEEQDLWISPNRSIAAIGNLILHVCGNARQWVLSGLGDKQDNRNRQMEFELHPNIKKSELVFLMENVKVNLKQTIDDLPEEALVSSFNIQGFSVTGFSALVHVIEHFSYHTGQITFLTKWLTNADTRYYGNLDLNQLNNLN
jgi:uncharacterized damage-inducible protein DinB